MFFKNMIGFSIVGYFDVIYNVVCQNNKILNFIMYGIMYGDQFGKYIFDFMYFICVFVYFRLFLLYK